MHRAEPIRGTILSAAGLRSWRAPQGRGDEMDLNKNTEKGKSWDFLSFMRPPFLYVFS